MNDDLLEFKNEQLMLQQRLQVIEELVSQLLDEKERQETQLAGENQTLKQKSYDFQQFEEESISNRFWSEDEHCRFLTARLRNLNCAEMQQYIATRTVKQIRSHEQKYKSKLDDLLSKSNEDLPLLYCKLQQYAIKYQDISINKTLEQIYDLITPSYGQISRDISSVATDTFEQDIDRALFNVGVKRCRMIEQFNQYYELMEQELQDYHLSGSEDENEISNWHSSVISIRSFAKRFSNQKLLISSFEAVLLFETCRLESGFETHIRMLQKIGYAYHKLKLTKDPMYFVLENVKAAVGMNDVTFSEVAVIACCVCVLENIGQ